MDKRYASAAPILLASASPRRRELLEGLGIDFEVRPADIDESADIRDPAKLVRVLSRRKAEAVSSEGACVIGSDTAVYCRGKIYGKPHTEEGAIKMLSELNGKWHAVFTGVTVIFGGKERTFCVKSRVKFKLMSEDDIESYVRTKRPLDKAGAYGIQDGEVVEKYRGSYSNIVGLPLEALIKITKRIGVIYGVN